MQLDSLHLADAVQSSIKRTRDYPTHSDCTRGVTSLTEEEREELRQLQTAITSFDSQLMINAERILTEIFAEITIEPNNSRLPFYVNVAGPIGLNEITLEEYQAGKLEGTSEFPKQSDPHVYTIGLRTVFTKHHRYNVDDHDHTFPLVRGEASGNLEESKNLALRSGFDLNANDALDLGSDKTAQATLAEHYQEFSQFCYYTIISKAVSPDEAWELVKQKGDPRFGEAKVKESAIKFAQSIDVAIENVANIVLLNTQGQVIYKQVNHQIQPGSDLEAVATWKKSCGVIPQAKIGTGKGRVIGGSKDPEES